MSIIVDDKYTLIRDLGEGSFGNVYEARDQADNVYAIKTWKEYNQKMFEDERKACQLEHHNHLVKYIDSKIDAVMVDTDTGN